MDVGAPPFRVGFGRVAESGLDRDASYLGLRRPVPRPPTEGDRLLTPPRPTPLPALPRLRALAGHAAPRLLEGTLVPLLVFYSALRLLDLRGALAAALGWSYAALAWRLLTRRRVSGVLLLGAAGLTARTALALATGSAFLYFLQPTLGTVAVGAAFAVSVPLRRPLAQRLARDLVPLPEPLLAHPLIRRFFQRITLLWAATFLANAAAALWLLETSSLPTFLWLRPTIALASGATAAALSTAAFHRCLRAVTLPAAG